MNEQMNIFDFTRPTYKINTPIRLIELFAGIGTQAMAMKTLGADFEGHKISEWEINANFSYKAIHNPDDNTDYSKDIDAKDLPEILYKLGISNDGKEPMSIESIKSYQGGEKWQRSVYNAFMANNNIGSICNRKGEDLNIVDTDKYTYIMTYSFPCFTGDTLVLTSNGYKQIKDVQADDYVLTHTNKYQKVLASSKTGNKEIWEIKAKGIDSIRCTENHKFYVRKRLKDTVNDDGKKVRNYNEPEWVACKDLQNDDYYLGIGINQESKLPTWDDIKSYVGSNINTDLININKINSLLCNHAFWWLFGKTLGSGKFEKNKLVLNTSYHRRYLMTLVRVCGLDYILDESYYNGKLYISSNELNLIYSLFKNNNGKAVIPGFLIDMPCDFIESFIEGYSTSVQNILSFSNESKEFIYGFAQLVAKTYKSPYKISKVGKVEPNIRYSIDWRSFNANSLTFYENGYIWMPINNVENTNITEDVYDIEVEEDHSFMANGVIAHNCQDLSVAGKMKGMKRGAGTRSGLLWEVERLLKETEHLPQVLLMENVPQVHGEGNKEDFQEWIKFLESLGYSNYWEDLNAKNYGIPQSRNRTFMVSILGEYNYKFPSPIELDCVMKDYLEDDVEEKYYITNPKSLELIEELFKNGVIDENGNLVFDNRVTLKNNTADDELDSLEELINSEDGLFAYGLQLGDNIEQAECKDDDKVSKNTSNSPRHSTKECIDLTINNPRTNTIANCITARTDAGISNLAKTGNGVIERNGKS